MKDKVTTKKNTIKVNPKTSDCMERRMNVAMNAYSRKIDEMRNADDFDFYAVDYFTDEELDEICEEVLSEMTDEDIQLLDEAVVTYGHDTEDPTPSRGERVKAAIKRVASGAKKVAKKLARGAGEVVGAARAGYRDASSSSTNSSSSSSTTSSSSSSSGGSSSSPERVRLRDRLKNAIKKGVGKLARGVSKVGDKVATRLGEQVDVLTFGGYMAEAGGRQGGGTIRPPKPDKKKVETKPPTDRNAVRFGKVEERGDYWHPDPDEDRKLGGPGANQRAREDRAAASKPKEDPKKLRPGESYKDYSNRVQGKSPAQPAAKPSLGDRIKSKLGKAIDRVGGINSSYEVEGELVESQDDGFTGEATSYKGVVIRRTKTGYEAPRFDLTSNSLDGIKNNIDKKIKESSVKEDMVDEAIRNPESRKKLRDIEDKEVRKGDKSKGENPRSKYSTEKGKLAGHLLRGPESTGSKGNPVRSRGGTNAPADERVGRGPHRAGNAAYWAGNAGPNRDRGAGNKAARRAGKSVPNTRDMVDEAKVDKTLPEYKRSAARTARYGNPYGSVGSGPQRDRRADHEARRGVKKVKEDHMTFSDFMEEGMSMKDFKANRRKNERKAASTDSERRSLVGKEWHNTGRKYTPDEAKSRRANMSDDDRAARHRAAVDPDDDRDENTYSADRTKNPKKQRKQAAMGEMMTFSDFMESRRSEREGKGSPESPLSYPGRAIKKERGEKGGRHQYSGSVEYGGAAAERGVKKKSPYSQHQRLRNLSNYPEKPGKYSEKLRKKTDLGSRFD